MKISLPDNLKSYKGLGRFLIENRDKIVFTGVSLESESDEYVVSKIPLTSKDYTIPLVRVHGTDTRIYYINDLYKLIKSGLISMHEKV